MQVTMKALQIKTFGKPTMVPELIESDPPEPATGQVLVALEAAPINPSDLLLIRGRYGHRPALPAALGTEGVGRIVSLGSAVDPVRMGERVLILPPWRTALGRTRSRSTKVTSSQSIQRLTFSSWRCSAST